MFIALTEDNKKISIETAVPGESYLCPACGNPVFVKAASSDNVRTHFAHKRNCICLDNWKHDMSDWHFDWQAKFPIETREVVIQKDGAVHRADVLINDTVIEFQHSPISAEEFESRNSFYKSCGYRVVWVFDATDRMKIDDCNDLVWKRKNTIFSAMKTSIDGFFIQNYLPGKIDLLCLSKLSPKDVHFYQTNPLILPENFLKEFGAIQDDSVLSIQDIFEKTKKLHLESMRRHRELQEQTIRAAANAAFNGLTAVRRHNRRF